MFEDRPSTPPRMSRTPKNLSWAPVPLPGFHDVAHPEYGSLSGWRRAAKAGGWRLRGRDGVREYPCDERGLIDARRGRPPVRAPEPLDASGADDGRDHPVGEARCSARMMFVAGGFVRLGRYWCRNDATMPRDEWIEDIGHARIPAGRVESYMPLPALPRPSIEGAWCRPGRIVGPPVAPPPDAPMLVLAGGRIRLGAVVVDGERGARGGVTWRMTGPESAAISHLYRLPDGIELDVHAEHLVSVTVSGSAADTGTRESRTDGEGRNETTERPGSARVAEDAVVAASSRLGRRIVVGARSRLGGGVKLGQGVRVGDEVSVQPWARLRRKVRVGDGATVESHVVVDPRCEIGGRARLCSRACVGGRSSVGEHAVVGESARIGRAVSIGEHAVVGDSVVIGDGAVVASSALVGDEARIGVGCAVGTGSVVGEKVELDAGTVVGDGAHVLRATDVMRFGPLSELGGTLALWRTENGEARASIFDWTGSLEQMEAMLRRRPCSQELNVEHLGSREARREPLALHEDAWAAHAEGALVALSAARSWIEQHDWNPTRAPLEPLRRGGWPDQRPVAPPMFAWWTWRGRRVFVSGEAMSEDGRIWVSDADTGEHHRPWVKALGRCDADAPTEHDCVDRHVTWARAGNIESMSWLEAWHRGWNPRAALWFGVAAVRAGCPGGHERESGWKSALEEAIGVMYE